MTEKITQYQFGSITIDGKNYSRDLWISLKGEVKPWQRRESHQVELKDLEEAIKENPEIVIIGTGAYGIVEIREEVKDWLTEKGIELIAIPTEEAKEEYNQLRTKRKIVGLFHLTC